MPTIDSIKSRLAKYSARAESGCLEWHGYKDKNGYGILLVTKDGKKNNRKAHRLSYELHVAPIPAQMFVCHSCDNPSCIEPSHLFVGTAADNNADKMKKGRYRPGGKPHLGSMNGRAKLDEQQVTGIRCLVREYGIPAAAIARSLGMSACAVQRAVKGKTWNSLS
jgi:hypothetical protein